MVVSNGSHMLDIAKKVVERVVTIGIKANPESYWMVDYTREGIRQGPSRM